MSFKIYDPVEQINLQTQLQLQSILKSLCFSRNITINNA